MEGTAVNMPHKRRHKSKVTIARMKTFRRTSNPKRTSSEQAIDQERFSSVPPIPTRSLDANTSQEESVTIDIEPSPSEHCANETQTDEREQRSQLSTNDDIIDSLHTAVLEGDWQSANSNDLHKKYPDIWERPITQKKMNALQVAVAAKQTTFVMKLLSCMTPEQLEFKNANGDTALAFTALSGSVKIAKKMVTMNDKLPMIRNNQDILPLLTAAMHRQRDMVVYLYGVITFAELTPDERIKLLLHVIFCDLYDIAKGILTEDPKLATAKDKNGCTALEQLARKPFAIGSRSQMSAWERCVGYC